MALGDFTLLMLLTLATLALAQRPFYSGTGVGYSKSVINETAAIVGGSGKRAGEITQDITTTTERLPVEALGDRNLVERLRRLPIDRQPFWLINWQALEANRRNPQTYSFRPSHFGLPPHSSPNSGPAIVGTIPVNTDFDTANTGFKTESIEFNTTNTRLSTVSSGNDFSNSGFGIPIKTTTKINAKTNPISLIDDENKGSTIMNSENVKNFSNSENGFVIPENVFGSPINGFANRENGIPNWAPNNINVNRSPSSSQDNRNEDSSSTNSATGLEIVSSIRANSVAKFKTAISSSTGDNTNTNQTNTDPSFVPNNRDKGSAIMGTVNTNSFANPSTGFAKTDNGLLNSALGTTNLNVNPNAALDNNRQGVLMTSNSPIENLNTAFGHGSQAAYPEFENVYSFSQPDVNESNEYSDDEADDMSHSNENYHSGFHHSNNDYRKHFASSV